MTGGEPLLHPRFPDLVEIVQREKLRLTVETNGLLCTPEVVAAIAASPGAFVSVSIDGADAETHEWVRGVAGAFDAACRAVRLLAEAGLRPQVIFSVMRANVHQVEAIVRLAEELGAGSLKFNVVQPTARGEKLHQDAGTLGIDELIALGRRVDTVLAKSTSLRLFFDYPMAFRPLSRMAAPGGCSVCGIYGILGVLPTGHYALCGIGEQVPDMVFGRIGEDPLESVWRDSAVLNAIRTGLPDDLRGICAECLVKERCLGACIAQNYYRSGDLFAPNWFCEAADAEGLFPETRRGVRHFSAEFKPNNVS